MKALLQKIRQILRDRRTRRLFTRFVSGIAAVIVFVTTYALVLPAITMEAAAGCGLEAHQHDDSCYEDQLVCGQEESDGHTHTADCYDEEGNLICGIEESAEHHHTDACYERALVCGKEEHTHSADCYRDNGNVQQVTPENAGDVAENVSDTLAIQADPDDSGMSEAMDGGRTAADAMTATDASEMNPGAAGYAPTLDALEFTNLLNADTGIYYHHITESEGENSETAAGDGISNSRHITDWRRVDDDTVLGEHDLLRVYLAYTIPAGSLNETNPVARYRLPANLHLTDDQVRLINGTINGIAGQYVNGTYDTGILADDQNLELSDQDSFRQYLGIEAIEGTRTPDQDIQKYNEDHGGQEYISALVRVEDDHAGQDLVFTFAPYTIEKNCNEYDEEGNLTRDGEELRGWVSFDIQAEQVDWNRADSDTGVMEAEVLFAPEESANPVDGLFAGNEIAAKLKLETDRTEDQPEDAGDAKDVEGRAEQALSNDDAENQDGVDDKPGVTNADLTPDNKEQGKDEKTTDLAETASDQTVNLLAVSFEERIEVSGGALSTDSVQSKEAAGKTTITVHVDAEEGTFPEGTTMHLSAVSEGEMDSVANALESAVEGRTRGFHAVDISFRNSAGEEIEPLKPISVSMRSKEIKRAVDDKSTAPVVMHVKEEKNGEDTASVIKVDELPANTAGTDNESDDNKDTLSFEAESFSVYAIVYTVDFHWNVDGEEYSLSIPGGGYISFASLVEAFGLAEEHRKDHVESNSIVSGHDVSEETRDFVSEVENITLSSPGLLWIEKADRTTTVGSLKKEKNLEVEYSTDLTEDQINTINDQKVEKGDWVLISLAPFLSEESLLVTMRDGQSFSVRVTDAQIKKTVLSADGNTYEITITYDDSAQIPDGAELKVEEIEENDDRYEAVQKDISENLKGEADRIPLHPALFDISIFANGKKIEPAEGSNVQVDVKLAREAAQGMYAGEDSPVLVNDAPVKESMTEAVQSLQVIHRIESGKLEVMETSDTITDTEVRSTFTTDSFSDWLVFLDQDVSEITIGKNDTITLRPYSTWVWKKTEELDEYKGAEWYFPEDKWSKTGDWTSNTGTGTVSTQNGKYSFTRKSKWDAETRERYDVLHCQATQEGTFDLQVAKNGTVINTIKIKVVGDVQDTPPAVTETADIKVNLFDYDVPYQKYQNGYDIPNTFDFTKSGDLDVSGNVAKSWDQQQDGKYYDNNRNQYNTPPYNSSVNAKSDLKFLGWGASNSSSEWFAINNYSKDVPDQGILNPQLIGGYPQLGESTNGGTRGQPSLKYLFDTSSKDHSVYAFPNVTGLFQRDGEGYYYYNSNANYAYYETDASKNPDNKITVYQHTYSQWTDNSDGANAKPIGFFPFHKYDSYMIPNGMNYNKVFNHHFGMSMAVDFEIPSDGLDEHGNPIVFEFSGDDDMWVFIDNNLVLDVGGIHQPVTASINFSADRVSVYGEPDTTITKKFQEAGSTKAWEIGDGKPHTMKIFYLERGGCDSNLSLKFNLPARYGKGKLKLVKRDQDSTTPLKGATFKLWDNPECTGDPIGTYVTDDNGKIDFGQFVLKSKNDVFYLKETESPAGYLREPSVMQVKPRLDAQGEPVKDADHEYIILDIYKGGAALPYDTVVNDSVLFPNEKVETISIPAKKTWKGSPADSAVVTLTVKRYKLVDRTKGVTILKEFSGMPKDYHFDASYQITLPDGTTQTVDYSQFTNNAYTIENAPAGAYKIVEAVRSDAPNGYNMAHSEQTWQETLTEDNGLLAEFKTTFVQKMGKLTVKADMTYNDNNVPVNYSNVRYVVVDSQGNKVASATYQEAHSNTGKTFDLPIGTYSVKAVSIPKKPGSYSLNQRNTYNNNTVSGTVRDNITVPEAVAGTNPEVVQFNSTYTKNVANNCTWAIKDVYGKQEGNYYNNNVTYRSGAVYFPAGTVVRMTFTADADSNYMGNNDTRVEYNGGTLVPDIGKDCNGRDEYSVEFTVTDHKQLVFKVNSKDKDAKHISNPVFQVLKEAPGTYTMMSPAPGTASNANEAADTAVSLKAVNINDVPALPENKKYVEDSWSKEVVLNKGNNWINNDDLKDLPASDEEGNKYYYFVASVNETGLTQGTVCSIDLDNGKQLLVGKDLNSGSSLGVTNEVPGSLFVKKEVTVNGKNVTDQSAASPADGTYTFTITKKDDDTFAARTVDLVITNGRAATSEEITGLLAGTYIITETRPENGTVISKINGQESSVYSTEAEVQAGKTGSNAVVVTFTNDITFGDVSFTKKDGSGEKVLPGAVFTLYKSYEDGELGEPLKKGEIDVTATSGSDGKVEFSDIPVGTYYMKETSAPEGYVLSPRIYEVTIENKEDTTKKSKIIDADGKEVTEIVNIPTHDNPDVPGGSVEKHKRIDALRDGKTNPDSPHTGEDLTDLYRLYLDYKIDSVQKPEGVDLLLILDHSGSMNSNRWGGNENRATTIQAVLNDTTYYDPETYEDFTVPGLIPDFLNKNTGNRWAAVGFKGAPGGFYELDPGFRQENAGQNDSEILPAGHGYSWNEQAYDILLPLEYGYLTGQSVLTDYTAGLWRAEQFLKDNQGQKPDNRKKILLFISDGLPTLYIDCEDTLEGAGTKTGSAYFPADKGGCVNQTKTQFNNFLKDLKSYGYTFGEDIELYTVGFGNSALANGGGKELLNWMAATAYSGTNVKASDHFFGFEDGDIYTTAEAIKEKLGATIGLGESYSNVVIQDQLSQYVNILGEGSDETARNILKKAGTRLTMTNPDPQSQAEEIVLYQNGEITENGRDILQGVEYDKQHRTVTATFKPDYEPLSGITYTLSYDVKASEEAYREYKESGYGLTVGDTDTDYTGTSPENSTSAGHAGFHSNENATLSYKHVKGESVDNLKEEYEHPVIQVFTAPMKITKTDQTGEPVAGAEFNLYDDGYDTSKGFDSTENTAHKLNTLPLKSHIVELDGGKKEAQITLENLKHGTYYLVETKTPDGYNTLEGPVKIEVTVNTTVTTGQDGLVKTKDVVNAKASVNGVPITIPNLQETSAGSNDWQLKVVNNSGAELPATGGPGTRLLYALGTVMIMTAGILLLMRQHN